MENEIKQYPEQRPMQKLKNRDGWWRLSLLTSLRASAGVKSSPSIIPFGSNSSKRTTCQRKRYLIELQFEILQCDYAFRFETIE